MRKLLFLSMILSVAACSQEARVTQPSNCAPSCVAPEICDEEKSVCVQGCGLTFCEADAICNPQTQECEPPCDPLNCPAPSVCDDATNGCVNPCEHLSCELGCIEATGECAGPCTGVLCEAGFFCEEPTGACVSLCEAVTCDTGFVCDELRGICVGVCEGRLCGDGEVCNPVTGVCEPESTGACTADQVPQPNVGVVSPAGLDGCPAGMARSSVAGVCMDRWEAHLVEVAGDGSTAPWSPYFNPGTSRVRAVSAPGAVPQGYITQVQATAACVEAGKRLCSRTEWEAVCRGASGWTYPYGNTRIDGLCNDARTPHPVVEYFGTSDAWIWSELDHPCINQLHDSLDRTGDNTGCVTPEGFYDLMGNLHEWIDDPAGTFKGGYYVDTVINGNGCLYTTTAHNVSHWDYSTGFRCCADSP